ncbi:MAG TPA: histidine kinase [Euzebyales bacterium]|nr:histidine kinase [Euzebyales bacterium]
MTTPRPPLGARPQAFDIALAVVLAVAGAASAALASMWGAVPDRQVDLIGFALAAGAGLILAVRRRWPLPTLAAATTMTSAYLIAGYPYGFIWLSFAVAVYTVARDRPLRQALPPAVATLPVLLLHLLTNSAALPGLLGIAPATAWVAVPFAIGATRRLALEAAAQARAEALRQHIDDERLRVAQEVHDIVGHGLAAIKMQADIALHVLAKKPEQTHTALDAISRTSSEALDELRATLAVVRRSPTDTSRVPGPGISRIDDLRQRMADAGLDVRVQTAGSPRALPAVVDLAGYRIVQESLTNVLRHSAAKTATVTVGYDDGAVRIAVTNPAQDVADTAGGLGIAGMRRRVSALGGEFHAGATADGRFEVRASIPTGGQP